MKRPECMEFAKFECLWGHCNCANEDTRAPCCVCGQSLFDTDEARLEREEIDLFASAAMGFSS
jgi:hypothetical protein